MLSGIPPALLIRVLLRILIAAAPLAGLLGTVTGMHQTFAGLGTAGDSGPMNAIAGGISQALVTTQAGLLIAVPALIALHPLRRQRSRLARSLSLLESVIEWRKLRPDPSDPSS